MTVTLRELAAKGIGTLVGTGDQPLRGVHHDSRRVGAGDLFAALPGARVDGASFVPHAVKSGAAAVMAEVELSQDIPQLIVADARRALGPIAHAIYGHPTRAMDVVGITGTNGKTTTAFLLRHALRSLGCRPALMGTVETSLPDGSGGGPSAFTTPEADEIARFADRARTQRATHLVMEVSSHGLAMFRADAVTFRVAAFTNLSQDHLDYHGTFEAYAAAKTRLFTELQPTVSVICVDGAHGKSLANTLATTGAKLLTCSVNAPAPPRDEPVDLQVVRRSSGRDGIEASLRYRDQRYELKSGLVGDHNLENLLVALGVLVALDIPIEDGRVALSTAAAAPGRLERVPAGADLAVFVDYAHTPDALRRVLEALRPITPGRLLCVFGCGGDRDRDKRPRMGAAVREGADIAVVTSDNPRTEDPRAIIDDVLPAFRGLPILDLGGEGLDGQGFSGQGVSGQGVSGQVLDASQGVAVEVDRRRAIAAAIGGLRPGDTLLIAGKGHEDYQIVGTERFPFDDRIEATQALAGRKEAR